MLRISHSQVAASATALVAALAFSCHDRDTIWVAPGVGGSAGQGGAGGSGQGGSNLGGAAGSSVGGSSGSGAGGSAGSAGSSAGSGGSGQAGTENLPPDAGPDADAPESGGPVLTAHQQVATAICARLDEVDPCQPSSPTCRDDIVGGWEFVQASADPSCAATIDAYFNCQATDSLGSFDCNGTDSTPQFIVPTSGACSDEENAFFLAADPSNTCP